MLDKVISRLKEEVAMDGYKGTSISDVWTLIQRFLDEEVKNTIINSNNNSRMAAITAPIVDSSYKRFFWRQFRFVSNLSFFDQEQLAIVEQQLKDSGGEEDEDKDIELNYNFIQDIIQLEYDQVELKYGDNLRVVADKALQEAQLLVGVPIGQVLSKNLRNYLTTILQARESGITQAQLTKIWNVDSRSSGHFVKSLELKGAIYRNYVVYNSIRTNLCIHTRFKNRDVVIGPSDVVKCANVNILGVHFNRAAFVIRLTDLLKDAKDNMMFSSDIKSAMGFDLTDVKLRKWFNRTLEALVHKGLIQKMAAVDAHGRPQRCIQLLNSSSKPSSDLNNHGDPGNIDSHFADIGPCILKAKNKQPDNHVLMHGASLEYQILRIIQSSGTKGVTHMEIGAALRCDNSRISARILDKLGEISGEERLKYGVEKGLEFEGRNRRYRYYAYATYLEMTNSSTVDIPDVDPFTFDESALEEVDQSTLIVGTPMYAKKKPTGRPRKHPLKEKVPKPPKQPRRQPSKKAKELENPSNQPPKKPQSSDEGVTLAPIFSGTNSSSVDPAPSTLSTTTEPSTASSIEPPTEPFTAPFPVHLPESSLVSGQITEESQQTVNQTQLSVPSSTTEGHQETVDQASSSNNNSQALQSDLEHQTTTTLNLSTTTKDSSTDQQQQQQRTDQPFGSPVTLLNTELTSNAPSVTIPQQAPMVTIDSTTSDTTQAPVDNKRSSPEKAIESTMKKQRTQPPRRGTIMGYFKAVPREEKRITRSTTRLATSTDSIPPIVPVSDAASPTTTDLETSTSDVMTSTTDIVASTTDKVASTTDTVVSTTDTATSTIDTVTSTTDTATSTIDTVTSTTDTATSTSDVVASTSDLAVSTSDLESTSEVASTSDMTPTLETDTPTSTGTSSRIPVRFTFKKKPTQINNYLQQRKQILLAILEDTKIVEKGTILKNRYGDKYVELFGDSTSTRTYKIDTKTLWRSALALAQEGLVHIREGDVLLLNGNRTKKEVLIHKSLDPNGPEVNSYFELLTDQRMLQPHVIKINPLLKTDAVVESLEDRLDRMRQSQKHARAIGNMMDAKRLDMEIRAIEDSTAKSNKTFAPADFKATSWVVFGMQFGFINSRMVRVKLLHDYLLELLHSDIGLTDGVDIETRTISTIAIIMNMSLGICCKLIGIFESTKEFTAFMQNEANESLKLGELPDNIRGCIFTSKIKFRAKLRLLIECLVFLGVVKEADINVAKADDSPSRLELKYTLATEATIRNYRILGHPPVRTHSLLDQTSIMAYWSDLEFTCTKAELEEGEEEIPPTNDNDEGHYIRALYSMKNWSIKGVFTRNQRSILNKYVDRDLRTTPLKNLVWCRDIAAEVGTSLLSVCSYYSKLEEAMDPILKVTRRKKPKTSRRPQRSRYRMANAENMISTPFKYKRAKALTVNKLSSTYQEGLGNEESNGWNDDSNVLTIAHDDPFSKLVRTRSKRKVWTIEEDDLLKLCHVIIDHRKEHGHLFRWKPVSDLLDHFSISQCRARLRILREQPKHAEDIQSIRVRWNQIYNKGIKDGTLINCRNVKNEDFNLVDNVTFYLQQCQSDDIFSFQETYTRIASTASIIEENYTVGTFSSHSHPDDDFFEDDYHQKDTAIGKRHALYLHSFTMRTNRPQSYDNPPTRIYQDFNEKQLKIDLLKQFFKMLLFTPGDLYDPWYAHGFMTSFPDDILKAAIDQSQKEGMVIHSKGDRVLDRRIPKTVLGMSEKFMRSMTMQLPGNVWSQAKKYDSYLTLTRKSPLDPVQLNESMMLCVLDAFSNGKLSINMENTEDFYEKFGKPSHAMRQIDESYHDYDMSLAMMESRDVATPNIRKEQDIMRLGGSQLGMVLDKLCKKQGDQIAALVRSLVTYLRSRGNDGATLVEVKQAIQDESNVDENLDQMVISAVELITAESTPPLAAFVGYSDSRLVLATELEKWTIQPSIINVTSVEDNPPKRRKKITPTDTTASDRGVIELDGDQGNESVDVSQATEDSGTTKEPRRKRQRQQDDFSAVTSQRQEELKQQRKQVIKPLIWNDINGHVMDTIWKGCLDLVMEALLRRPGVTLAQLCRILSATLLQNEIADILKYLTQLGAIRQVSVSTGSSGLFKSNQLLRTVPNFAIDSSRQTSYWLVPGFYNLLP